MALPLKAAPSSREIREELRKAVLKDLLGPAAGPEEEVDERSVRERYLVGALAPKQQSFEPEVSAPGDNTGYPPAAEDSLAIGGETETEDGKPDAVALPTRMLFPSSFGLTFGVDVGAKSLKLTVRWGQYRREVSETLVDQKTGNPKRIWKRRPIEASTQPVPLKEGRMKPWIPVGEFPDVTVQGKVRKYRSYWVVTLFLVNGQEEPKTLRDAAWLFQPELIVEAPDGTPIFVRRLPPRAKGKADAVLFAEEQSLEMLYRRQVEFAVGHGVSVRAVPVGGQPDRATRVQTQVVPEYEVPTVTPPTGEDFPKLAGLVLDMKELGEAAQAELPVKLRALTEAYRAWIEDQRKRIADAAEGLQPYKEQAEAALKRCERAVQRVGEGVELLRTDGQAAAAFCFANWAMYLQRRQSLFSAAVRRGEKPDLASFDRPEDHRWYPFQLAFVLMNLPGITRLDHADRSPEADATADLLWFPTGGGKTEAYLGLTAYTLALRRLQGTVAGRSGEYGVAVLMRYTLRLLTIQQFQRATALICACEIIRREALDKNDKRWGLEPFRLGLWVGKKVTPNTTAQCEEAIKQGRGQRAPEGGLGTPLQLTYCPWCGATVEPGKHIRVEGVKQGRGRTFTYCGDPLGKCPFTMKKAPDEGLPLLVVDEEIYRRLPALVIATVDKFAQLPWFGQTQMLFGHVDSVCERHGFRSSEIEDADKHNARNTLPPAKTRPCNLLRPPDLIVQDELHLISGPLGTLVGLYETAIDRMCTWEVNGKLVRPKVIASTATIRNAKTQVHCLFMRKVEVFPPHGLDVGDSFFALQRDVKDEKYPGRLYLGICAPGRRLKAALIRVYLAYLSAVQMLYNKYGKAADPWMTLLGYFNSMRELGGMRRLVDDDIRTRLRGMESRGLAKRSLGIGDVEELTSRRNSADIPRILDLLEMPFDPNAPAGQSKRPISVLLATNMVSVGVDVKRLGLMVVGGQPKATAEYIQATSRVGRSFPGMICTVFNWARPRDLSHYETFEHYHATFYKHVEALSVTPFATRALDRGLTALLVALVRLRSKDFNSNESAGRVQGTHALVKEAIECISARAGQVTQKAETEGFVRDLLNARVDEWLARVQGTKGGAELGYRAQRDTKTLGLLTMAGKGDWKLFTCLTSLRDVEPGVGLILDERQMDDDPSFVPAVNVEDEDAEEGQE